MTADERINDLETALENLLDCFDNGFIEVETIGGEGESIITTGEVADYVKEAINFAAEILAEDYDVDAEIV